MEPSKNEIMRYLFILFLIVVLQNSCTQKTKKFGNPILAGFYPDPSICRVDNDYYLVNSTFAYFPGIPVFHSKDLVNWELIGHVLDRAEQLDTEGFGLSRGIFAPAITHDDGIFYVTCTIVDGGGNFVVTSEKPQGPYSNPVWLPEIHGIDPSLYFDDNGKAYILYNSDAPDNKPLYEGHRTIRMFEFDVKNLKVTGKEKLLINGGSDINKKPIWIEDSNSDDAIWPVINPDHEEVQYYYDYPDISAPISEDAIPYSGNFTIKYDFDDEPLHRNFKFLRTPREKWYDFKEKGYVSIHLRPETCSGTSNPSLLGHRQQHLNCSASISFIFEPSNENEKAGLLIFLNESHFYFLCIR